jgi:L-ribulokinase
MKSSKYSIGVDYGTLSGRAVLVDIADGRELASAEYKYPHGVMDTELPWSGRKLPNDWALQHPQDYLDVLANTIPRLIKDSGIQARDIIGVGVDFTSSTLLPVKSDGTPLCFLTEFRDEPHAYVKLWKHHAAQREANRMTELAVERKEKWLIHYGGRISSEWAIPKIWQVLNEAPEIYGAADAFVEAADWVVWALTGRRTCNSCSAGYKSLWNKAEGYPSDEFFASLDPRLEHIVDEKLTRAIDPLGTKAGEVTAKAAGLTGLLPGTAVSVGNVDAHVCVPSVGICSPGKMLAIMGTSTCLMIMSEEEKFVPGICGDVEDGIMPGLFGYEAGQPCVGDSFAWFIDNCLTAECREKAKAQGMNIHAYLRSLADKLRPGESGLLALDWWNGNRSVLNDADLTGLILGLTLRTKPEEIYRALIEATAFGAKTIVEAFRESGVAVDEFYASGGIAQKDPMTMQIYADVLNMPVHIADSAQGPARGAAIFGAVAAGGAAGGYESVFEGARIMGKVKPEIYVPNTESAAVYAKLFKEYTTLCAYFGRGENNVMKRLKALGRETKA